MWSGGRRESEDAWPDGTTHRVMPPLQGTQLAIKPPLHGVLIDRLCVGRGRHVEVAAAKTGRSI